MKNAGTIGILAAAAVATAAGLIYAYSPASKPPPIPEPIKPSPPSGAGQAPKPKPPPKPTDELPGQVSPGLSWNDNPGPFPPGTQAAQDAAALAEKVEGGIDWKDFDPFA